MEARVYQHAERLENAGTYHTRKYAKGRQPIFAATPSALAGKGETRDLGAAVAFHLGERPPGAHSASADALAAARVLDAQVGRYPDLPADPAGLHRLLAEADVGGRFRLDPRGGVVFAFGKYIGVALGEVAERNAGYLRWMLGTGLLDDARGLVEDALAPRLN